MGISKKLASFCWSAVNQGIRDSRRALGLRGRKLPVKTISIGNLQVGGSGKTPCVAALARSAISAGRVPLILTRGYRSAWEKTGGVLAPLSEVSVAECGDEALVLRALAPDAWIGIGSDRSESFDRAFGLAQSVGRPIDLVILDDGFQHFALDRDVDLILMTDRSSSEVVFRDSWKSISQASLLIFGSGGSWPHPERLPDIRVERSLIWIQELPRPEASVGLVTSVASPERVVRALKDQEIQVVRHWSERDHATFTSAWVSQVIQEAKAHGIPVVMTLKDWVKWREVADPTFAVGVIETQWTVTEGISLWEGLWR